MWGKKSKEETQVSVGEEEAVGADQEKKSRLILQFAARQDLVPTRGSKNRVGGGGWVYQPSSPCYTSSDSLSHSKTEHVSVFRQGPGSSQVGSHWCWPKIRPRMRLADLSTGYCGTLEGTSSISASQRPYSLPDALLHLPSPL